ncbi:UNKNOWN [Stylonychia lemnae]|uniref:Uncharacterized protein n=1 Tax=Stylonychia lemnae TaxID=5949 RepID=A0A078AZW4_STYLE|nr:UNKNOWN [Stylonychia lemnae]|eukprot:CDW86333.1 UNKNOWN [Stylonychia lemnae]
MTKCLMKYLTCLNVPYVLIQQVKLVELGIVVICFVRSALKGMQEISNPLNVHYVEIPSKLGETSKQMTKRILSINDSGFFKQLMNKMRDEQLNKIQTQNKIDRIQQNLMMDTTLKSACSVSDNQFSTTSNTQLTHQLDPQKEEESSVQEIQQFQQRDQFMIENEDYDYSSSESFLLTNHPRFIIDPKDLIQSQDSILNFTLYLALYPNLKAKIFQSMETKKLVLCDINLKIRELKEIISIIYRYHDLTKKEIRIYLATQNHLEVNLLKFKFLRVKLSH